jgi:hypothetical protein
MIRIGQLDKTDAAMEALAQAIGGRPKEAAFRDPVVRAADAALNDICRSSTPEELAAWAERDHRRKCPDPACRCKAATA